MNFLPHSSADSQACQLFSITESIATADNSIIYALENQRNAGLSPCIYKRTPLA